MNSSIEFLRKMSEDLMLDYSPQDWGIINSSSTRVKEFIEYFNLKENGIEDVAKYNLFELIIASFNDAIVENKVDQELEKYFIGFLNKNIHTKNFEPIIAYWRKISNTEEYPIGEILNRIDKK